MFNWLFRRNRAPDTPAPQPEADDATPVNGGFFSTDLPRLSGIKLLERALARTFQVTPDMMRPVASNGSAMDAVTDATNLNQVKSAYQIQSPIITDAQLNFYSMHGFIGFQMCAIIAQNWLVNKACRLPAQDACRNGYELTVNDGSAVPPKVLDYIVMRDKQMNLKANLRDFIYFGRMYGIRIAMFEVTSSDKEYYEKPFNIDGVTPGSYKGIVQVDPYWCAPELNGDAASNPASMHFYEPTWWRIHGQRIHRSHLIIYKGAEVADILKPSYMYAGLSLPQMIFERVYAADRTANEAPMLAATKRETVVHCDTDKALSDQLAFEDKIASWTYFRNNHGIKIAGIDEEIEQFETSLSGLDETIMTQYQLVASISNIPVTKLLGTVPKGFNSTGQYEQSSYHEELEGIQENDLTPLISRHHLLLMRSEIKPKFKVGKEFEIHLKWHPLDVVTHEEKAKVNLVKAQAGAIYVKNRVISPEDERARIVADKDSGYNGVKHGTTVNPSEDAHVE